MVISEKLRDLWSMDERYWQQRSRISWLKEGESNSKYFHLTIIVRRQKNKVLKLKLSNGLWCEGDVAIRKVFESYFTEVYSSCANRSWGNCFEGVKHVITREMNQNLLMPFTLEEIKEATLQLGALKAPGPDGYPGIFYQRCWEVVNGIVVDTTNDFLEGRVALEEMNRMHIALIPKVPFPETASQFRPISLCNNSYKIMAKAMANRLKMLLPSLISQNQNAFVPMRLIQDNISLAHEIFHYLKLRKRGGKHELGLKIDILKAYDRVE